MGALPVRGMMTGERLNLRPVLSMGCQVQPELMCFAALESRYRGVGFFRKGSAGKREGRDLPCRRQHLQSMQLPLAR